MFEFYPWVRFDLQIVMQVGVLFAFIYFLSQYRKDNFSVLLLLMFFPSFFMFLGTMVNNLYKIVVLAYTIYCTNQRKVWSLQSRFNQLWTVAFVLFTVAFFVAVSNSSGNTVTIIFSQYARYLEIYCLYFLLHDAIYRRQQGQILLRLFYQIFWVQILISVLKFILFNGRQIESLVGSMSIIGGAMGTTIPILGFIVLWFYRNGKMSWKDWLFVAGLLLVGFTTGKRAVWFILPFVIAAFMVYVQGIRLNKYIVLGIAAIPIVFYFGARLTPTLNPEHKVWGSFDLEYMFDYAETYQFGEEGLAVPMEPPVQLSSVGGKLSTTGPIDAEGRGGATIALIELLFSDYPLQKGDIWGIGFSNMYSIDYATFAKLPLTISLNHKGSATGLFQSYVTTGYVGIFTTILFCFLPFFFIHHRRLRWVLLGIAVWEYFMYTGIIFRTPAFMAVFLFVMFYSNQQIEMAQWRKKARKRLQEIENNTYETINYSTRI